MRTYSFLMLVFIGFQLQGQSTIVDTATLPVTSLSTKVNNWMTEALTIKTDSRKYKNVLSANVPFFRTYGVNYARKIAPTLAVELSYKNYDYENTRRGLIFRMFLTKKSTLGHEFGASIRQYFLGEVFDGVYAEYGASYAQLNITRKQYIDPERIIFHESFYRTYDHTAKVDLYTGKLGMGYSATRNHFYMDIVAGAHGKKIKYLDRHKHFIYRSWPIYCKIALGYAF